MAKWSLALRVLPFALLVVALKGGVVLAGFQVLEASPLLSSIVTANVFLLGFLLAGTLTDYKESERLPGEVASHLESIADECWILHRATGAAPAAACMDGVAALGHDISAWFRSEVETDDLLRTVTRLDAHFLAFEPHTQANFISRLKSEQAAIRSKLVRISTIRTTGFVSAAYAIAEIGLALLVVGLLISDVGSPVQASFVVGVIAFFLGYMLLLIKDLDDPFEHAEPTPSRWAGRAGGDEVSYAAVEAAVARIEELATELQPAVTTLHPERDAA